MTNSSALRKYGHYGALTKVKVTAYFLPRMKTKWGSCNASAGHIRLTTELVTKPKDSREYVVVHEMTHSSSPLTISALSGFSNSTTQAAAKPVPNSMICRYRQKYGNKRIAVV